MNKDLSLGDKVFNAINILLVLLVTIIIAYPLVYVLSASISSPQAVNTGRMWLWPVDLTFEGFRQVFQNDAIWLGYRNTIFYTILGTILHLVVLLPASYALAQKRLPGKKYITWFILFTMLFNGGLIPTFLVVDGLGMLNTIWAIVIPGVVGAWSILVVRSFFSENVPVQLIEAAKIDGASDFTVFFQIALPLSMPIIAVMGLFHAVGLWNQYFGALIYLSDRSLYPLQLILREILVVNQMGAGNITDGAGIGTATSFAEQLEAASLVKYAVIIVSTLPILMVYPFIQKYFVKGVLIGSVKE